MGFSINKIILVGKIGRDPETRFTTANVSITNFSLATDHSYKGKDGNYVHETTWHNLVFFNLSDFHRQSLAKGATVYVEGRMTKKEYTDKEGIKRYNTDIIGDNASLIVFGKNGRDTSEQSSEQTPPSGGKNNAPEDNDLPF